MTMQPTDFQQIGAQVDYIWPLAWGPLEVTTKSSLTPGVNPERVIHFIGSSDVEDLDGDIVRKSFLDDMTTTLVPGSWSFIEHTYDFAHVQGKTDRPCEVRLEPPNTSGLIKAATPFNALHAWVEIDETNPEAVRIGNLAQKGYRVGSSLGAYVPPDAAEPRMNSAGYVTGSIVHHGVGLEISSTVMPSNQQSYAVLNKSLLVRKGVLDPRNPRETAYRLKHVQDDARENPMTATALLKVRAAAIAEGILLAAGKTYGSLTPIERSELALRVKESLYA